MRNLLWTLALAVCTPACVLAQDEAKKTAEENWKISGWETTTCCCNDICPCRYNEKPTHMECESIIAIHVDKGQYGKTRLDNVNFILIGRGFDENSKGWNKIYFDQKVTPEALLAAADRRPAAQREQHGAVVKVRWAFFAGLTVFVVDLHAPGQDAPIRLEMRFRDGIWQVTRVWLPPELINRAEAQT